MKVVTAPIVALRCPGWLEERRVRPTSPIPNRRLSYGRIAAEFGESEEPRTPTRRMQDPGLEQDFEC
jgi:hypothetical protein